jgi:large subunit ribosomal protein L15
MDILSKLQAPEGAVKGRTRVGRGVGSGLGKTAGRGQKGQKARSKGNINKLHFQGGQTPMQRRLPKRGFRNPLAPVVANVNVGDLDRFDAGTDVSTEALRKLRLVRGRFDILKILGNGDLTKNITVTAHKFSKSAAEKIEKAGGKAVVLAPPAARSTMGARPAKPGSASKPGGARPDKPGAAAPNPPGAKPSAPQAS